MTTQLISPYLNPQFYVSGWSLNDIVRQTERPHSPKLYNRKHIAAPVTLPYVRIQHIDVDQVGRELVQ